MRDTYVYYQSIWGHTSKCLYGNQLALNGNFHFQGSTAKFHIFDDIDGPQTSGRHLCETIGAELPSPKTKVTAFFLILWKIIMA